MKFSPIKIAPRFLCLIFSALTVILACNKDKDDPYATVEDVSASDSKEASNDKNAVKLTAKVTETRTTSFSPIQDAYLQSGIGYDQKIVRLEDGRRKSYLMFDLSTIESLGDSLVQADFEFTISSDGGDGTISVFRGKSGDWSEEELSAQSAPVAEVLLAQATDEYEIGQTKRIRLDSKLLRPGIITLVMTHKDGNDLAFASKEHPDDKIPKLVVSYQVPSGGNSNDEDDAEEEPASGNPVLTAVAQGAPLTGDGPLTVKFNAWNSKGENRIVGYSWDFKDGSGTTKKNPEHTFSEPGTYQVALTVTDEKGLTDNTTIQVTVDGEGSGTSNSGETNENEGNGNGDLTAVAQGKPLVGDAPLKVDFNAWNSKGKNRIVAYSWDFKDGSGTTKKNPEHTFSEPGEYQVALTATDEKGLTDSTTIQVIVNGEGSNTNGGNDTNGSGSGNSGSGNNGGDSNSSGNQAPVAVAQGSPLSGYAPLNVDFNAWNSKDDKRVTGYFWDFKDGSTTTKKNPSHRFTDPGVYEVQLSVKDAEGLTGETSIKVTVNQRSNGSGSGGSSGGGTGSSGGGSSGNGGGSGSGNSGSSNGNSGNYPSNAVFASSFGFKSGDATAAFEAALRSGNSYVVIDKQSSDWVIRPTRFFDLRNMTIVFEPGVTLRAKSGAFKSEGARLFQLTRANNVTIEGSGATFRMNRSEYTSGEQRHALDIGRSRDITVRGLTIRDSGGDGVHIAGDGNSDYSQNITIENVKSLNNRRDGITIVSAQDVWVRNSEFLQSSGKKPEAGATLEADRPTERLVNINFIGCKFKGNDSAGFHLSTVRMNGSSRPLSIKVIDCEFSNNAVSPSSGVPTTEVYLGGGRGTNVVGGEIRFERAKFNGSRGRVIFTRKSAKGFKAVFKDCEARNVVTSISGSPIRLEAHEDRNTLGGIAFDDFYLEYNRNAPFMHINAPSNGGSFDVKDVIGSFSIKEPNDHPLRYSGGYRPDKNVNVSIDYDHN